jgi:hypothetical protein
MPPTRLQVVPSAIPLNTLYPKSTWVSFSILSDDRSNASSKTVPPHSNLSNKSKNFSREYNACPVRFYFPSYPYCSRILPMLSNASPNLAFRVEWVIWNRQLFLWPPWLCLVFCSYFVNVKVLYCISCTSSQITRYCFICLGRKGRVVHIVNYIPTP